MKQHQQNQQFSNELRARRNSPLAMQKSNQSEPTSGIENEKVLVPTIIESQPHALDTSLTHQKPGHQTYTKKTSEIYLKNIRSHQEKVRAPSTYEESLKAQMKQPHPESHPRVTTGAASSKQTTTSGQRGSSAARSAETKSTTEAMERITMMDDQINKFRSSLYKREQMIQGLVKSTAERKASNVVVQPQQSPMSANTLLKPTNIFRGDHQSISSMVSPYYPPSLEDETDTKPVLYKRVQELQKMNNDLLKELRTTNDRLLGIKHEKETLQDKLKIAQDRASMATRTAMPGRRGASQPREIEKGTNPSLAQREKEESKAKDLQKDYLPKLALGGVVIAKFLGAMHRLQRAVMNKEEQNLSRLRNEFESAKMQLQTIGKEMQELSEKVAPFSRASANTTPTKGMSKSKSNVKVEAQSSEEQIGEKEMQEKIKKIRDEIMREKREEISKLMTVIDKFEKETGKYKAETAQAKIIIEKLTSEKKNMENLVEVLKSANNAKIQEKQKSDKDALVKSEKLIGEYKKTVDVLEKNESSMRAAVKELSEVIKLKEKENAELKSRKHSNAMDKSKLLEVLRALNEGMDNVIIEKKAEIEGKCDKLFIEMVQKYEDALKNIKLLGVAELRMENNKLKAINKNLNSEILKKETIIKDFNIKLKELTEKSSKSEEISQLKHLHKGESDALNEALKGKDKKISELEGSLKFTKCEFSSTIEKLQSQVNSLEEKLLEKENELREANLGVENERNENSIKLKELQAEFEEKQKAGVNFTKKEMLGYVEKQLQNLWENQIGTIKSQLASQIGAAFDKLNSLTPLLSTVQFSYSKAIDRLRGILQTSQKSIKEAEIEIAEKEKQNIALTAKCSVLQNSINQLQNDITKQKSDFLEITERLTSAKMELAQLRDEKGDAKGKKANEHIEAMKKDLIASYDSKLVIKTQENAELVKKLSIETSNTKELTLQVEANKKTIAEYKSKNESQSQRITVLEKDIQNLNKNLSQANDNLQKATSEVTQLRKNDSDKVKTIGQLESLLSSTQEDFASQKLSLEEKRKEDLKEAQTKFNIEITGLRSQYDELKKNIIKEEAKNEQASKDLIKQEAAFEESKKKYSDELQGRLAELESLKKENEKITEKSKKLTEDLAREEKNSTNLKQEIELLKEAAKNLNQENNKAIEDLKLKNNEALQNKDIELLEEKKQVEKLTQELENAQDNLAKAKADITKLRQADQDMQRAVSEKVHSIKEFESKLLEVKQQTVDQKAILEQKLKDEAKVIEVKLKKSLEECESWKSKVATLEQENSKLAKKLQHESSVVSEKDNKYSEEIKRTQNDIESLKKQNEKLIEQNGRLSEELTEETNNSANLQKNISSLKEEKKNYEQENASLNSTNKKLTQEIASLKTAMQSSEKEIANQLQELKLNSSSALNNKESELANEKQKVEQQKQELTTLKEKMGQMNIEVSKLKQAGLLSQSEIEEKNKAIKQAELQLLDSNKEAANQKSKLEKTISDINNQLENAKQKIAEEEGKATELEKELNKKIADIKRMEDKHAKQLNQIHSEFELLKVKHDEEIKTERSNCEQLREEIKLLTANTENAKVEKIKQLEELKTSNNDALQKKESELAMEKKKTEEISKELSTVKEALSQATAKSIEEEKIKTDLKTQVASLQQKASDLQGKCNTQNQKVTELSSQINEINKKYTTLEQEKAVEIGKLHESLNGYIQRCNSLNEEMQKEKEKSLSLEKDNEQLKKDHQEESKENEKKLELDKVELKALKDKLQEEQKLKEMQKLSIEQKLTSAQEELETAKSNNTDMKTYLTEVSAKLTTIEKDKKQIEVAKRKIEEENSDLHKKIITMASSHQKEKQALVDSHKKQMSAFTDISPRATSQINSISMQLKMAQEESNNYKTELENIRENVTQYESIKNSMEKENQELIKKLHKADQRKAKLQEDIQRSMENYVKSLDKKLIKSKEMMLSITAKIALCLQSSCDKLLQALKAITKSTASIKEKHKQAIQSQAEEYNKKESNLNEKINKAKKILNELVDKNKELESKLENEKSLSAKKLGDASQIEKNCAELTNKLTILESKNEKAKLLMKEKLTIMTNTTIQVLSNKVKALEQAFNTIVGKTWISIRTQLLKNIKENLVVKIANLTQETVLIKQKQSESENKIIELQTKLQEMTLNYSLAQAQAKKVQQEKEDNKAQFDKTIETLNLNEEQSRAKIIDLQNQLQLSQNTAKEYKKAEEEDKALIKDLNNSIAKKEAQLKILSNENKSSTEKTNALLIQEQETSASLRQEIQQLNKKISQQVEILQSKEAIIKECEKSLQDMSTIKKQLESKMAESGKLLAKETEKLEQKQKSLDEKEITLKDLIGKMRESEAKNLEIVKEKDKTIEQLRFSQIEVLKQTEELKAEKEKNDTKLKEDKQTIAEFESKLQNLQADKHKAIEELNIQLNQLSQKLSLAQGENSNQKEASKKMQTEHEESLREKQDLIAELERRFQHAQEEISAGRTEKKRSIDELKVELGQLTQENIKYKKEEAEKKEDLKKKDAEIASLKNASIKKDSELTEQKKEKDQTEAKLKEAISQMANLNTEINKLRDGSAANANNYTQEISQLKKQISDLTTEKQAFEQAQKSIIAEWEEKAKKLTAELEDIKKEKQKAEENQAKMEHQIKEIKQRIRVYTETSLKGVSLIKSFITQELAGKALHSTELLLSQWKPAMTSLKSICASKISSLQQENDKQRKYIGDLIETVRKLKPFKQESIEKKEKCQQLEKTCESLNLTIKEKEALIVDLQERIKQQITSTTRTIDSTTELKTAASIEIEHLTKANHELQSEKLSLQKSIQEMSKAMMDLNKRKNDIQQELEAMKEQPKFLAPPPNSKLPLSEAQLLQSPVYDLNRKIQSGSRPETSKNVKFFGEELKFDAHKSCSNLSERQNSSASANTCPLPNEEVVRMKVELEELKKKQNLTGMKEKKEHMLHLKIAFMKMAEGIPTDLKDVNNLLIPLCSMLEMSKEEVNSLNEKRKLKEKEAAEKKGGFMGFLTGGKKK